MNDRFRFRAWNKEDNKMYEAEGVYAYKDESTKGGEVFLKGVKTSYYFPEQVELMQCTGLKDKNGKLIYEGDILKCYYIDSDTDNQEFDLMKMVYNDKYCAFGLIGLKTSHFEDFVNCDYIAEDYEVIGNIYENKELLEVK